MALIENVRQSDVYDELNQPSSSLLLAVSGGPDSTALLHLFARLRQRGDLNPNLFVGHVQHDMREEGPEEDRRFTRELAEKLNLPFRFRHVAVRDEVERNSVSPEEAARKKRYDALEDMCGETGSDVILTAHHRNDQIVTILLRLLNGTGIRGLRGIREQRLLRDGSLEGDKDAGNELQLMRPLLSVSRNAIIDYLNHHDLPWRTDPSNRQLHLRRNFVREVLVPHVRKRLGSSFPDLLLRIRDRAKQVDRQLRNRWSSINLDYEHHDGRVMIRRNQVEDLSPMLYTCFLRRVKQLLSLEDTGFRYHDLRRLKSLLKTGRTGREESLSGGVLVRLEHGWMMAERTGSGKEMSETVPGRAALSMPGRASWGRNEISARPAMTKKSEAVERMQTDPWSEVVDVSRIEGRLSVTCRRRGDRMRPLGLPGNKKVKDMMIDQKIPSSRRERWPVVRDRRKIVWIPGLRLSHHVRITNDTRSKHVFELRCRRSGE